MRVFIGTQAAAPGQGIYAARLDGATGRLSAVSLAAEVERPTWLLADPENALLYAVSEVGNAGDREGEVRSFAIAPGDNGLRLLSRTGSGGGGATHLALDAAAATLFVANYGGGQVAAVPVTPDGRLSPVRSIQAHCGSGPHRRQAGPHPHGVTPDPTRRYLLAPDMGADRVFVHRFDAATRALSPAEVACTALPAGSGPRLILFGRDGRFAYLLTELSAELFTFRWDAGRGRLHEVGRTALDGGAGEGPRSAAALAIAGDGRFLYASNRTTNAIHVYAIDPDSGLLAERQAIASGGAKPWAAEVSPGGRWLLVANQGSDTVQVFAIDPDNGRLTPTDGATVVPTPTGIAFADRPA